MSLPQKLLEYRRREKLSQEDLAAQLGVSRQSVSKWEQGLSFPETEKLIELSSRMGISIDCLLKGEQEPSEPQPEPIGEGTEESPAPKSKPWLTLILAILLTVTSVALVFTLWRQEHPNLGQADETYPQTSEPTAETTSPVETTEPVQTEPEPTAQSLQNADLLELRDWFFRFGRAYRLDYMPRFTAEDGPPTDSGEYLYWAFAVNLDNWGADRGQMSMGYVNDIVKKHFQVLVTDHRSHHKQWTYDDQSQIYTAWPEGGRPAPYYLLNSIQVEGDCFTVHATCYTPLVYVDSVEIDTMVYEALMAGKTEDLKPLSQVTVTFRLNTLSFTDDGDEPGTPVFVAHEVTEYQ